MDNNTLYFEKISQFDRAAEPVTVSIPFAAGALTDAARLRILDGERVLPVQARPLTRWEDGSIKWLLVHCLPDLPGNRAATLHFDLDGDGAATAAAAPAGATDDARVTVTRSEDGGLCLDTGVLAGTIPATGFWPVRDVTLDGRAPWGDCPFAGFQLVLDGEQLDTRTGAVELELEEEGPLRAVVLVRGQHRRADGSGCFELRGRITAWAGKPWIEVEHQFVHAEDSEERALESLRLAFTPAAASGQPRLALGEGYYRTSVRESEQPLSMTLDTETILYQANEHFIDSFYGDFWVDWRDDAGGLTASIHQAHQNFPKALTVTPAGIDCDLYPAGQPPAPVLQGMAKTHRLQLHFHAPDAPLQDLSGRSLQFQLPDRPALDRAWYREHNPWRERFFPAALPARLLTLLNNLHDGRPKALGMMHFGDAPDAGYTNQGRGRGETVFVNNEYDRPHCCTLYYALTGQRRVLDSALVTARHWLDVDLCHHHPDPLLHGGLKIHTRYHGTGRVTPSHEWTEGLLDYYVLTGRREALDAAVGVAENILRHMDQPHMRQPGASSVREGGWALRALVGMWVATGEQRWRDEARGIIDRFLAWAAEYGALLAPYTSHSMPRVPFMIFLTVNSFARYLLIEPDNEAVKKLVVDVVDDVIEHCLGPDGIFYYKELPSLRRTAPTPHALEALTYAYRITDKDHYLRLAARQFAAMGSAPAGGGGVKQADASGAVLVGSGGGRNFADRYTSVLLFAGAATAAGLLDWYEYPFAAEPVA